ncbi:hypothetical protein CANCADRAFT_30258 [Tortispora caseinolytica NRRL Y-17796]|uniref:GTP cyclohydrolase N-terminal domain-containing protein n=1 Tax=Tortispora caseinolytica NRRL Y-17796 TaxID=767744 RepID=A0A1E4TJP2_9ASCO|nr:hypothetical protein CANCADRAFT_30258 [Tortispora caseinolytica NRRL Y-17796]
MTETNGNSDILAQIAATLNDLKQQQAALAAKIDALAASKTTASLSDSSAPTLPAPIVKAPDSPPHKNAKPITASSATTSQKWGPRVVLTTYPHQSGVKPIPLHWGNSDPMARGPLVASRAPEAVKYRNCIGAHGGSYSIYHALAVAIDDLPVDHIPNYENAQPPVVFGPFPQWGDSKKIVSLDPFGHVAPWIFSKWTAPDGTPVQVRPTMAITKAHMSLVEMERAVATGRIKVDGKIVINDRGDLAVTKVAAEPVWYLPGVAERFNISETALRRALFEDTGGSYPELITRPDIKVFLPPIGGLTVYIFGDVSKIADTNYKLALRVHDECNGSDVFGSDICTCRPYLLFGIEEAVKEAQNGGSGVVIYFRKEGRALGEVTKYLVYNARKRYGDSAAEYFTRTENIAGVKDMRFQALMPDILHWLGITKIDRMLSMSNMKHDAIVSQGISIIERVPIPEDMIPEDSRVEIDAKISAGYFTDGRVLTESELAEVHGRPWEDVDH